MAWAKIDDQFFFNPKVIVCDKDAKLLYIAGLTYASGQLTDGLIPHAALPLIGIMAGVANTQASAERLLDVCLWFACEDGYSIHDYLEYNIPREKVLAVRELRKLAGSKGGQASLGRRRVANAQANAGALALSKTQANHVAISDTHTPINPIDKSIGAPPKKTKPKGVDLGPIFDAFTNATMPRPMIGTHKETDAAQLLIRNFPANVSDIPECWQDIEQGRYGGDYERRKLGFYLLMNDNIFANWLHWVGSGRPALAPRNGRSQDAIPEPPEFVRPSND